MQVLIKTVDGTEETVHTDTSLLTDHPAVRRNAPKAISTEKNVVTFPLAEESDMGNTGRIFERYIHLDNLVFYRYFPEEMRGNGGTGKTLTVKTKQGEFETVEEVLNFYPSSFYLVVESHNCITNFPLRNVLSYDVQ